MRLETRLEVIYVLYDWKGINGMQQMIEPEVGAQRKNAYVGYGVFWRQRKHARRGIAARFLMKKEEQDFQNPKLGVPQIFCTQS